MENPYLAAENSLPNYGMRFFVLKFTAPHSGGMEIIMQKLDINISTDFIKLDQLLKFSGIAENGADAKAMVVEGMVSFNDVPCLMRGKKVRAGDKVTIEFEDETVEITVGTD